MLDQCSCLHEWDKDLLEAGLRNLISASSWNIYYLKSGEPLEAMEKSESENFNKLMNILLGMVEDSGMGKDELIQKMEARKEYEEKLLVYIHQMPLCEKTLESELTKSHFSG